MNTLNIVADKIKVVGNTYGAPFETGVEISPRLPPPFRFLMIAAAYPHKQLEILNQLCPLLEKRGIDCQFYLTLTPENFEKLFERKWRNNRIFNLGVLAPEEVPNAYTLCDAVFMPSLLEIFSATYPEALKMKLTNSHQ